MRMYTRILSSLLLICLVAFMAIGIGSAGQTSDQSPPVKMGNSSAGAGAQMGPDQKGPGEMRPPNGTPGEMGHPPDFANNTEFRDKFLSDLESKGVDTSELKAALESGDKDKIRTLMDSFKDKFPAGPQNGTPGQRPDGRGPTGERGDQKMPGDRAAGRSDATSTPAQSMPIPTSTQSPLSPITILAGIGAAGLAISSLKRE